MLPRLKMVYFAMPPRWLKPVNTINSPYLTITFTISDPDGSIIGAFMKGRSALFGKEVVIEKWFDKLPLIQCSRCHRLGHLRNSKACPLNKDSVKCHICGGAHKSDEHNQRCPCRHAVAGTCDCTIYKCLNCHRLSHHCHKERCPTQALFHLWNTRCVDRSKDKGKGRDPHEGLGLQADSTSEQGPSDAEDDPFYVPPLPPNPTRPQICTALHKKSDAAMLQAMIHTMEVNTDPPLCPPPGTAASPLP